MWPALRMMLTNFHYVIKTFYKKNDTWQYFNKKMLKMQKNALTPKPQM
jgi:hypothetical protein